LEQRQCALSGALSRVDVWRRLIDMAA
jgi:hypothetical protein